LAPDLQNLQLVTQGDVEISQRVVRQVPENQGNVQQLIQSQTSKSSECDNQIDLQGKDEMSELSVVVIETARA
jgi:hypothetical protein